MNDLSVAALARLDSDKRLFAIEGSHGLSECAVDRWHMKDAVSHERELTVDVLHLNACLDMDPL